jgi:hypothetical protein
MLSCWSFELPSQRAFSVTADGAFWRDSCEIVSSLAFPNIIIKRLRAHVNVKEKETTEVLQEAS